MLDNEHGSSIEIGLPTVTFSHLPSRDGREIYYLEYARNISIRRIRISDGSIEIVRDLKDLPLTGMWSSSVTLTPDDSPLLLRNIGTHDVY